MYQYPDERNEPIIPVGCQVAAKVSTGFWILCRVMRHVTAHGTAGPRYIVEDSDTDDVSPLGSAKKQYTLPPKNVVRLPVDENDPTLLEHTVGATVHAVYPETTTFYPATVKSSFRKRKSREYQLAFDGDEPEDLKLVHLSSVVYIPDP
mmetsp:Transcript_17753/g.31526  ORF Transcript_17753/g.31526 Transcript_17753/m.31526 type:complete len:149 (+) Transcript_17753:220-666(+)